MNLREFAEQVLFGNSLESKLRPPPAIADDCPGDAIITPSLPGRPAELEFFKGRSGFEFPSLQQLDQGDVRGRLLHFFANHELLATELMALALLRFPDAPKSFRLGLLQTLKDEQVHTRVYIDRMKELGVAFGQYPVTGFFWRTISRMSTPLDYVSHLSLTFEQANLDYSKWYAEQFRIAGDPKTEAILDRIHQDEIGHVGYGLRWFRRWKDPSQTDWQAFKNHLTLPLSPSRAKGAPFNVEARQKAGLNSEFIDELFVYSKSKGRTPGVYLFNPYAEYRIGRGRAFTPKRHQEALARDLSNLPQFLCRKDDVVLVPRRPRTAFLSGLKRNTFELPEFQELDESQIPNESDLRTRKIDALRPWAWSPDSIETLMPLLSNLNGPAMPIHKEWNSLIKPLFSKCWSADRLSEFLSETSDRDWLCPDWHAGVSVSTYSAALDAIRAIRARGHISVVAKAPFGMAGANMCRLWEPALTNAQESWIRNTIQTDGVLVIEPWVDRILDFSIQFEMKESSLQLLGIVRAENDRRGQYQASVFSPNFTFGFDQSLAAFVSGTTQNRLRNLARSLGSFLEPRLRSAGFTGPLGIDAFVYREQNQMFRAKPIVEINPRFTMGRVLIELMRYAMPGRIGIFQLVNRSALRREQSASFADYAQNLQYRHPVELSGRPKQKIASGAVCLTDPEMAECCLAVFKVGRNFEELAKSR